MYRVACTGTSLGTACFSHSKTSLSVYVAKGICVLELNIPV